jgi:hypothetical protein
MMLASPKRASFTSLALCTAAKPPSPSLSPAAGAGGPRFRGGKKWGLDPGARWAAASGAAVQRVAQRSRRPCCDSCLPLPALLPPPSLPRLPARGRHPCPPPPPPPACARSPISSHAASTYRSPSSSCSTSEGVSCSSSSLLGLLCWEPPAGRGEEGVDEGVGEVMGLVRPCDAAESPVCSKLARWDRARCMGVMTRLPSPLEERANCTARRPTVPSLAASCSIVGAAAAASPAPQPPPLGTSSEGRPSEDSRCILSWR